MIVLVKLELFYVIFQMRFFASGWQGNFPIVVNFLTAAISAAIGRKRNVIKISSLQRQICIQVIMLSKKALKSSIK